MILDNQVAARMAMLRFILIGIVVFLHISDPPAVATLDFSNAFDILRAFTQGLLGRICVPALTMISGYLLFSARLDLAPLKLVKKKARTLLVPFFIFNVCYVGLVAVLEYTTGYVAFSPIKGAEAMRVLNMLFGIEGAPLNNPLHFIRELFILILLSPFIGLLLRRAPLFGLGLVSIFFLFDMDRHLILRDTMAVMFYIGGMAAVGRWDVKKYDRYAVHCAAILLVLCAGLLALRVEDRTLIYIAAPLLVWPMASLLQDTAPGKWAQRHSHYSFFIFLSHMPLIEIARRIYLHVDHIVPEAVFVYGVPFLLIAGLIQAYKCLDYLMPAAFAIAVGGRSSKPAAPAPLQAAIAH